MRPLFMKFPAGMRRAAQGVDAPSSICGLRGGHQE